MKPEKRGCERNMVLMIDANVVLDVLCKREPNYKYSSKIWKLCETGICTGIVSTLSFANIIYIMRKELTSDKIESVLKQLQLIFTFSELSQNILEDAAKLKWSDFEDAEQEISAKRVNADYIIKWNVKDFAKSDIPVLTPAELLFRF